MAQITFENLTNEWTALSEITTVDASTTYRIQNRGADTLIALESDSEPEADNQDGILVLPYKEVIYKKGTQDLYLRAFNRSCAINITSEA